ncbi:uncharacterized protein EURHEDRAFT_489591 [Aspergillus ruber CBS 135680]|uniref:Uncharacterized protein n=1 Tax=Aspergillus ruber (strain CBS 135680) TaxID=1388766 RepID=A0A017S0N8_ASPRC|nr:uncharacterized protein EURHEDRAFT_489591 [Aspergillus ruber CBS 135680]EYE90189.1 hypothetical protein EURHEDRAFT_489591 [Aspergillus ruber CBS 135680]
MELHNHELVFGDTKDISAFVSSTIILDLLERSDIVSHRRVFVGIIHCSLDSSDGVGWRPIEFGVTKYKSSSSALCIQDHVMPSAPIRVASSTLQHSSAGRDKQRTKYC